MTSKKTPLLFDAALVPIIAVFEFRLYAFYVHSYRNMYFYELDEPMVWLYLWIPSIILSFAAMKTALRLQLPAIFGFTVSLVVLLVIMRLLFHARK